MTGTIANRNVLYSLNTSVAVNTIDNTRKYLSFAYMIPISHTKIQNGVTNGSAVYADGVKINSLVKLNTNLLTTIFKTDSELYTIFARILGQSPLITSCYIMLVPYETVIVTPVGNSIVTDTGDVLVTDTGDTVTASSSPSISIVWNDIDLLQCFYQLNSRVYPVCILPEAIEPFNSPFYVYHTLDLISNFERIRSSQQPATIYGAYKSLMYYIGFDIEQAMIENGYVINPALDPEGFTTAMASLLSDSGLYGVNVQIMNEYAGHFTVAELLYVSMNQTDETNVRFYSKIAEVEDLTDSLTAAKFGIPDLNSFGEFYSLDIQPVYEKALLANNVNSLGVQDNNNFGYSQKPLLSYDKNMNNFIGSLTTDSERAKSHSTFLYKAFYTYSSLIPILQAPYINQNMGDIVIDVDSYNTMARNIEVVLDVLSDRGILSAVTSPTGTPYTVTRLTAAQIQSRLLFNPEIAEQYFDARGLIYAYFLIGASVMLIDLNTQTVINEVV